MVRTLPRLDNLRILGYALIVAGGCFRVWAMRTLGRYFTFRLSIRPDHKLIQDGPYGIVRNPSYTGIYIMVLGSSLIMMTGNAANRMMGSKAAHPIVRWTVAVLLTYAAAHGSFRGRIMSEENMLEENFGTEWKHYTRKVPYRLFPGLW